jgi:hypothetical protein
MTVRLSLTRCGVFLPSWPYDQSMVEMSERIQRGKQFETHNPHAGGAKLNGIYLSPSIYLYLSAYSGNSHIRGLSLDSPLAGIDCIHHLTDDEW